MYVFKKMSKEEILEAELIYFFYNFLHQAGVKEVSIKYIEKSLLTGYYNDVVYGKKIKDLLMLSPSDIFQNYYAQNRRCSYGNGTHKRVREAFFKFGFKKNEFPLLTE